MEDTSKKTKTLNKSLVIVLLLVVIALMTGYILGNQDGQINQTADTREANSNQESSAGAQEIESKVKELVTYTLPDGWGEASCKDSDAIFIIPAGAEKVDCDAFPSAPVKISIDPGNNTDCNQLQNVQNVRKHVCISEYINDMLSLKAQTIYKEQSSYGRETTIDSYYINTGSGVVLVEYVHQSVNSHQAGWERLSKSVARK